MLMGEENPFIDCTSSEVPRERQRGDLDSKGNGWKLETPRNLMKNREEKVERLSITGDYACPTTYSSLYLPCPVAPPSSLVAPSALQGRLGRGPDSEL